jgi:hypothetical protein
MSPTVTSPSYNEAVRACDAARDATDAARIEWQQKFYRFTRLIGIFYAHPAWLRYGRAMAAYDRAFDRYLAAYAAEVASWAALSPVPSPSASARPPVYYVN